MHSAWKPPSVSYRCRFYGDLVPFLHTFSSAISTASPPKGQTFTLSPRPCSGVHSSFRHCLLSGLYPRSFIGRCLTSFFFFPNEVMLSEGPAFTQCWLLAVLTRFCLNFSFHLKFLIVKAQWRADVPDFARSTEPIISPGFLRPSLRRLPSWRSLVDVSVTNLQALLPPKSLALMMYDRASDPATMH